MVRDHKFAAVVTRPQPIPALRLLAHSLIYLALKILKPLDCLLVVYLLTPLYPGGSNRKLRVMAFSAPFAGGAVVDEASLGRVEFDSSSHDFRFSSCLIQLWSGLLKVACVHLLALVV